MCFFNFMFRNVIPKCSSGGGMYFGRCCEGPTTMYAFLLSWKMLHTKHHLGRKSWIFTGMHAVTFILNFVAFKSLRNISGFLYITQSVVSCYPDTTCYHGTQHHLLKDSSFSTQCSCHPCQIPFDHSLRAWFWGLFCSIGLHMSPYWHCIHRPSDRFSGVGRFWNWEVWRLQLPIP